MKKLFLICLVKFRDKGSARSSIVWNMKDNIDHYLKNSNFSLWSPLRISIGLSVFGFVANEYQHRAIQLLSAIQIIGSAIR